MIISAYYWLIFLGIFLLGDIAVVPMLYLAVNGTLNFLIVVIFVFVANLVSDIIWWVIGLKIPSEKIMNLRFFRNKTKLIEKMNNGFSKKGWRLLAYSKFIYGIRPIVRVLCGVYKMSFKTYMIVNTVTTIVWIVLISGIAWFIKTSFSAFDNVVSHLEITITVFIICVALFDFWLYDAIKRRLGLANSNAKNPEHGNTDGNRNI